MEKEQLDIELEGLIYTVVFIPPYSETDPAGHYEAQILEVYLEGCDVYEFCCDEFVEELVEYIDKYEPETEEPF